MKRQLTAAAMATGGKNIKKVCYKIKGVDKVGKLLPIYLNYIFYKYYKTKLCLYNFSSYLADHFPFCNLLVNTFFKEHNDNYNRKTELHYIAKSDNFVLPQNFIWSLKEARSGKLNYYSIYSCSNDIFEVKENYEETQLFLGIGNLTSLDIISNLNPEILFFVDLNASQLKYLNFVINLIKKCKNRAKFLSLLFGRNLTELSKVLNEADSNREDSLSIEDRFWRCKEEVGYINEIHKEFLNYEVIKEDRIYKGIIHKKIGRDVFGGLKVVTTLILDDKKEIKTITNPFSVFPIYRSKGFLSSESKYNHLRNILLHKPYILIHGPLSSDLIWQVANEFRYYYTYCWLSNLLNPCFFSYNNKETLKLIDKLLYLKLLYLRYYGITILEDQRRQFFSRVYARKITPHWDAFRKIQKYIDSPCVEIVNVKKWVEQGATLLNTTRAYVTDFLNTKEDYKCIFIHILLGHGLDLESYKRIIKEAFRRGERIILLEHNKNSKDFLKENKGVTTEELIQMFGEPTYLEYSVGYKSNNRNIIMVYDRLQKTEMFREWKNPPQE